MNLEQLKQLRDSGQLKRVKFFESGRSPLVVQIEYFHSGELCEALLADDSGKITVLNNLEQGYQLCRSVGIHDACLMQIVTDDEACQALFAHYHIEPLELHF